MSCGRKTEDLPSPLQKSHYPESVRLSHHPDICALLFCGDIVVKQKGLSVLDSL